MQVTDLTRSVLTHRRFARKMTDAGWERIGPGDGVLLHLHCGGRIGHAITQVEIEPGGKALWVKIEPQELANG